MDGRGFVTPMEVIARGGSVSYLDLAHVPMTDPARLLEEKALRHRAAAEKLAELTSSWSERSVPTGTPNARAAATGGFPRGTIPGEMIDYFLQFKNFGLSFTSLQLEAIAEMASVRGGGTGLRSGLAYFAGLAVPMMVAGGAYIQIKKLLDGQDPEPMDKAFAFKAIITGGGFGLFGDFLKATQNRFGQTVIEALAGPGIAYLGDSLNLLFAILAQPDERAGKARQYAGRWTPIAASHPATRAAFNRVILDNLQWASDPKAQKSFKRRYQKAKSSGSPYFLPPGTLTPVGGKLPARRMPDLGNAVPGG